MSAESPKSSPSPFRQRLRAMREEEIIAAGSSVFSHQGCFTFKIEDVALQAGVAKGSIYAHFHSKREMLQTILARLEAQVLTEYSLRSQDISSESAARTKLVLVAEILLELESETRDFSQSLLSRLCCSLENSDRICEARRVETLVGSVIEGSQRSRLLKDTFPAATLAEVFVKMVTCQPFREMSHGASCRLAAEAAVDLFLHGVGSSAEAGT